MLETIKLILTYAEWLSLVAFIIIFAWLIQPITIIGAIVGYIVALFMFYLMFDLSSKKYSPKTRISGKNYLGNPIIDIVLIICLFQAYIDSHEWLPLGLAGMPIVYIDLIRWVLALFPAKRC